MTWRDTKLSYYDEKSQYVLMDTLGNVLDTCHTLFRIAEHDAPLFEHIPVLEGLREPIAALRPGEELPFSCIQTNLLGRTGYYDFIFRREDEHSILWLIYDFTEHYKALIPTQQERNNRAIEGEYLRIKQRAAQLENQLLEYKNEELQRIQAMKTAFFSQVSHEMRTPVNSIVGLVSLVEDPGSDNPRQYLAALRATSRHLAAIVNDVLDLSKLEAGQLSLEKIVFNLHDTLKHVADAFLYSCQEKGLALRCFVDEHLPTYFRGDPTRLAQVLYNLMGNAVKFTSAGSVTLRLDGQKKKVALGRSAFG